MPDRSLRLLTPFLPLLTEDTRQKLGGDEPSIMIAPYPIAEEILEDSEGERLIGAMKAMITTVRNVRAELGGQASIVFRMGADQLQQLDTWRDWRALFDLAHIGVAARPGYCLAEAALPFAGATAPQQPQGRLRPVRKPPAGPSYRAAPPAVAAQTPTERCANGK